MNDGVVIQSAPITGPVGRGTSGAGTIRSQLLGASLFPLAFFGLLSILVTATALYELTTRLASQRNAAQSQAYAYQAAWTNARDSASGSLLPFDASASEQGTEQVIIVDNRTGQIVSNAGPELVDAPFLQQAMLRFAGHGASQSLLTTSPVSQDQIILSYSQVPGRGESVLMAEPWSAAMTPAFYYQLVLVGLLLCGTLLSLSMLSVSLGRIIRPISDLAGTASRAIPGSIFHPVPERGPSELRSLTASFNQMVIQLAEQQATLRRYAQQALLSQEAERQRLSHELHDGTVQELVGLAQRLELCRGEMETNPARAKQRLEELKGLAQHTLNEVRQISNALRPSILQDLGLAAALGLLCDDLEEGMPGIQCACRLNDQQAGLPDQVRRLPAEIELAVFRVAQEALTNIRKHAERVTQVELVLDLSESGIQLTVTDNGGGAGQPDLNQLVRAGHLGFAGMHERARLFGGTLDVDSPPGSGTRVTMRLPLQPEMTSI